MNFCKKLLPASISPEKQYGYAIVAAMALVASADGVLEEEEAETAIKVIDNTKEIKKHLTTEEAHKAFLLYTTELMQSVNTEKTRFDIAVDILLQKIPNVEKEEWKHNIIQIAENMAESDGFVHEEEKKMIEKISAALWQSYKSYHPGI
ncbi:MAG: tellurite resistance TerB family protein [SAR324 cluster bacterium]|nr:tellurite resistance TerB family protein [SAR324 cluster bacterium]